jgi:hypothetical protein
MVDELGIVEWIDKVLPKDPEKQIVSYVGIPGRIVH